MTVGGSDEGGLDELVEFRPSCCSNSSMRRCIVAKRCSYDCIKARIAAWAARGTWSQTSAEMGGTGVMQLT